jgi:hypothetical protein
MKSLRSCSRELRDGRMEKRKVRAGGEVRRRRRRRRERDETNLELISCCLYSLFDDTRALPGVLR